MSESLFNAPRRPGAHPGAWRANFSADGKEQVRPILMGSKKKPSSAPKGAQAPDRGTDDPEWASGLRQLYDSVVEEELPDSFKDLLAQLDDTPKGSSGNPGSGAAQ